MSLVGLNKSLNRINSKKTLVKTTVNDATLTSIDSSVELEISGLPSIIIINYKGTVSIARNLNMFFKIKVSNNTILINNLFRKKMPLKLFDFMGDLTLIRCNIISCDGSKIDATIKNTQNLELINYSKTNLEDDSLVIFEERKRLSRTLPQSGLKKPASKTLFYSPTGSVQKYGKKEAEDISSIITEVAPSLIKKNGSIKTTLPSIRKRVSLKAKVSVPIKGVALNQKKKLGGKY